jgi:hypothetical protein
MSRGQVALPAEPVPASLSDEVKRRRRQRMFRALLEAKGQLIVLPDDGIH